MREHLFWNFLLHFRQNDDMIYLQSKKTIPKLWNRGAIPLRYGHRDDEPFPCAIDLWSRRRETVLTLSRDTCFGGSMECSAATYSWCQTSAKAFRFCGFFWRKILYCFTCAVVGSGDPLLPVLYCAFFLPLFMSFRNGNLAVKESPRGCNKLPVR